MSDRYKDRVNPRLSGLELTKHIQRLRAKWVKVPGCSQFSWTKYEQARKRRENRKRRKLQDEIKDEQYPQGVLE